LHTSNQSPDTFQLGILVLVDIGEDVTGYI
jgi:hypothetical protein